MRRVPLAWGPFRNCSWIQSLGSQLDWVRICYLVADRSLNLSVPQCLQPLNGDNVGTKPLVLLWGVNLCRALYIIPSTWWVLRKDNLSLCHLSLKPESAQIALVCQVSAPNGIGGSCLACGLQARILGPQPQLPLWSWGRGAGETQLTSQRTANLYHLGQLQISPKQADIELREDSELWDRDLNLAVIQLRSWSRHCQTFRVYSATRASVPKPDSPLPSPRCPACLAALPEVQGRTTQGCSQEGTGNANPRRIQVQRLVARKQENCSG